MRWQALYIWTSSCLRPGGRNHPGSRIQAARSGHTAWVPGPGTTAQPLCWHGSRWSGVYLPGIPWQNSYCRRSGPGGQRKWCCLRFLDYLGQLTNRWEASAQISRLQRQQRPVNWPNIVWLLEFCICGSYCCPSKKWAEYYGTFQRENTARVPRFR